MLLVYIKDVGVETYAKDKVLAMLDIKITFGTLSSLFNLVEAYT